MGWDKCSKKNTDDNGEDETIVPLLKQQLTLSTKDYDKDLLPAEGAAMDGHVTEEKEFLEKEKLV